MVDELDKIRRYLEKEGHTFLVRDDYFIIPWKIGELKFHITINLTHKKWLVVSTIIASFDEIPGEIEKDL